MKKSLLIALLLSLALLLPGCKKAHEITFIDTLPCDQADGYTWVARSTAGDTGQIFLEQTYREDETYALLGASGVLENEFAGVVPGYSIIRLYYVHASTWDGSNSDALGTAYYEFLIYDDLTISLLYSEVELPDSY